MTSQLRHHYEVSCKYWWDILQFFSHTDCQDNLCQQLWTKFVEVTAKYYRSFIPDTMYRQAVWSPDSADTVCPRPSVTFDCLILTGVRVASKMGNLRSKFGHARPLGSRIIGHGCDGRTDRRTDKSNTNCSLSYGRGHNNCRPNV